MKKPFIFITCCLAVVAVLSCKQSDVFQITNPGNDDLTDRVSVLSRDQVLQYAAKTASAGQLVARTGRGEWLPTQLDDLDGDGAWDELVFLYDLGAGENLEVTFEVPDTELVFPARTNIRFGRMDKPFEEVTGDLRMKTNDTRFTAPVYQMEGPAWENDVIAFRNYYDARNGIDIFGKTTSDMVLDSVGVNGRNYHELAGWGMDILKVGNSLGAGAIAIGIGDSLYRVGPCEEGNYRLVTEGPVRAILELTYKDMPAGDRLYDVRHQISIYAGDRFYRNKVWVNGLRGDETLVTGIVDLHNVPADSLSEGDMKILYSVGNQGFLDEGLGMGLLIPAGQVVKFGAAPTSGSGIVNTHLAWLKLTNDSPAEYRFVAVWENETTTVKEPGVFMDLLKEAVRK